MNSIPSAVWMSAEAARAVFPLAGSRREPWSDRMLAVLRRFAFITFSSTNRDTTPDSDHQHLDLAVADAGLQRRQVGRRGREPV